MLLNHSQEVRSCVEILMPAPDLEIVGAHDSCAAKESYTF